MSNQAINKSLMQIFSKMSMRNKIILGLVIIVGIIAISYFDLGWADEEEFTSELHLDKVKVKRVVDGDTLIASYPDGQEKRVRFIGLNTPESVKADTEVEYFAIEASDYTSEKLTGKTIYLEEDVSGTDQYGRVLAYLWLEEPVEPIDEAEIRAKMFNAIIILDGYANARSYPPDVKYQDYLRDCEAEAKKAKRGLWAPKN